MSAARRIRRQRRVQLGALDGRTIPLECEHCDAEAVVIISEHPVSIRHDADCPTHTDPAARLAAQMAGGVAVADQCEHPVMFVPRGPR